MTILLLAAGVQFFAAGAAAQLSLAQPAQHRSVEVFVEDGGAVTAKHVLAGANSPRQLDLINGTVQNLTVTHRGEPAQFARAGDRSIMVMPASGDISVQYRLEDALVGADGLWTWEFLYVETVSFYLPDTTGMVFVSGKAVILDDKKAIRCHGCQMTLEYFEGDKTRLAMPAGTDAVIPVITTADTENFRYEGNALKFETGGNAPLVIVMPQIPGGQYEVSFNGDVIRRHVSLSNETQVWLSMRLPSEGTVAISAPSPNTGALPNGSERSDEQQNNIVVQLSIIMAAVAAITGAAVIYLKKRA